MKFEPVSNFLAGQLMADPTVKELACGVVLHDLVLSKQGSLILAVVAVASSKFQGERGYYACHAWRASWPILRQFLLNYSSSTASMTEHASPITRLGSS